MIIEAQLQFKATEIKPDRCQVDEVVTLDHWNFEYLKNSTLDDFDFIEELRDKLPVTNDNTRHCIMVLDETGNDGILIDPQGYSYPRYSAYIPNAKQMLQMEQFPSLRAFNRDMMDTVEEVAKLAVNSQQDGELNAVIADEYCDEAIGEESGMSM